MLRPFWRYYGGKWRTAPTYPAPAHSTIVEPFAGAAGYSLRYPDRNVILVDRYAVIAEIWRYLIRVPAREVLAIPEVDDVGDLPGWVPEAARWLIGFTLNSAVTSPRNRLSSGKSKLRSSGRKFEGWTSATRDRVASQVDRIRHWRVIEGDYTAAPAVVATWFVDPPYRGTSGSHYVHGSSLIDYEALGEWCQTRRGHVVVCESAGADWLPFRGHGVTRGIGASLSQEAIWTKEAA